MQVKSWAASTRKSPISGQEQAAPDYSLVRQRAWDEAICWIPNVLFQQPRGKPLPVPDEMREKYKLPTVEQEKIYRLAQSDGLLEYFPPHARFSPTNERDIKALEHLQGEAKKANVDLEKIASYRPRQISVMPTDIEQILNQIVDGVILEEESRQKTKKMAAFLKGPGSGLTEDQKGALQEIVQPTFDTSNLELQIDRLRIIEANFVANNIGYQSGKEAVAELSGADIVAKHLARTGREKSLGRIARRAREHELRVADIVNPDERARLRLDFGTSEREFWEKQLEKEVAKSIEDAKGEDAKGRTSINIVPIDKSYQYASFTDAVVDATRAVVRHVFDAPNPRVELAFGK